MNNTIIEFLHNNNINLDDVDNQFFTVKSDTDINPILGRYYIPGRTINKEVSIANILGYSYENLALSQNLVYNLSHFFDEKGSGYQRRSVGMLTMGRDECVSILREVSKKDIVYVRECEDNKYIITQNGLHRYNVLRFHYLNELSKIDKADKRKFKALQDKYTIPVEVQQTDYIKTYSYFILKKLIPDIRLEAHYDEKYNRTGNAVVRHLDTKKVLTDEQLLNLLKITINKNSEKMNEYIDMCEFYAEMIPTFKRFLEENNIKLVAQEVSF